MPMPTSIPFGNDAKIDFNDIRDLQSATQDAEWRDIEIALLDLKLAADDQS